MKETVVKMNKTKSWFPELINKIDNQLVSSRKKREKNQINKIRNAKKKGTDNADIQKITRDHHKQ